MYRITTYDTSQNIGDAIQTIALSRLLPTCVGVSRHRLADASCRDLLYIVNGWHRLRGEFPKHDPRCLFAGIHCGTEHVPWVRQSPFPIGSRDPFTHKIMQDEGIESKMIGCASLTFQPYMGPREGVYTVDYEPGPGIALSHWRESPSPFIEQWTIAMEMLMLYQRAEAVYTSRLHVVLPCLAFGTPVAFFPTEFQTERYSLLSHLGVEPGHLIQRDISALREDYLTFLRTMLPDLSVGEPKLPLSPPS